MIMEAKYEDILFDAISTYGRKAQTDMCIEECSELIKALLKFRRLSLEERLTQKGQHVLQNIQEEIGDVQIMLWQMEIIYGCDNVNGEIERKIRRLQERIKRNEKSNQGGE